MTRTKSKAFCQHRPHKHGSRVCRLVLPITTTSSIFVLLRLCYFTVFILLIGVTPSTTFPLERSTPTTQNFSTQKENSDTTFFTSSSSASGSPSCIGCLSIPSEKVMEKKDDPYRSTRINYHVIGTSHFRCNSYKEVSTLIRQIQPDGVVIELDPERLLRLTLDDATVRDTLGTATTNEDEINAIGNRWFGGDFLSAIETAKELDIPIFLGDEYPIETRQRFMRTLLDPDSYNPRKLLTAFLSSLSPRRDCTINATSEVRSVDIIGTFFEDPDKLLPLVATLSLPILAVLSTVLIEETATKVNSNYEAVTTMLSLVTSFVASCKVYNNLIADRDIVLSANVKSSATTIMLLKSKQLIRKRWTFSINDNEEIAKQQTKPLPTGIPLFTLKNPLEKNSERNLNLFEPRWLKMIDRLLLPVNSIEKQMDNEVPNSIPPNSDHRIIGCVTCTNKFYSAVNIAKPSKNCSDPPVFKEGRYADVIFRRRGRFGELTSVTEGTRPSGARKVGAKIVGKEAFELPSPTDEKVNDLIEVVQEGYLTALSLQPINEDEATIDIHDEIENAPEEINIVVVVGLLHANGVLDCLQRMNPVIE